MKERHALSHKIESSQHAVNAQKRRRLRIVAVCTTSSMLLATVHCPTWAQSEFHSVVNAPVAAQDPARVSEFWRQLAAQKEVRAAATRFDVVGVHAPNPKVDVEARVAESLTAMHHEGVPVDEALSKVQEQQLRQAYTQQRNGTTQASVVDFFRSGDHLRVQDRSIFAGKMALVLDEVQAPEWLVKTAGPSTRALFNTPANASASLVEPMPLLVLAAPITSRFSASNSQVEFQAEQVVLTKKPVGALPASQAREVLTLSSSHLRPLRYQHYDFRGMIYSLIESSDYKQFDGVWMAQKMVAGVGRPGFAVAEYRLRRAVFNDKVDPADLRLSSKLNVYDLRAGEPPVIYTPRDGSLLPLDEVQKKAKEQQQQNNALQRDIGGQSSSGSPGGLQLLGAGFLGGGIYFFPRRRRRSKR